MIELDTGAIGLGKTSMVVAKARDIVAKEFRSLYVHGIRNLVIEHELIVCSSKTCKACNEIDKNPNDSRDNYKHAGKWNEWAEANAYIIIDEAQHVYRDATFKASIEAFEMSRQDGLDFHLITQHPMKLTPTVRQIVSRHIHFHRDFIGVKTFEWSECHARFEGKKEAIVKRRFLDTSTFGLYKSSDLHTKTKKSVPVAFYVFIVFFLVTAFLMYRFKTKRLDTPQSSVSAPAVSASAVPAASSSSSSASASASAVPAAFAAPVVPLAPVVRVGAPVGRSGSNLIVGRLYSGDKCKGQVVKDKVVFKVCFTEQNEIVYLRIT